MVLFMACIGIYFTCGIISGLLVYFMDYIVENGNYPITGIIYGNRNDILFKYTIMGLFSLIALLDCILTFINIIKNPKTKQEKK